ncbi:MAG: putative metalloprotease CJM1_0395 family protein [Verrucomicrobiae bacterium]|nr:putative metalloprotease CJM1_0395 family protein [Verrucomicrobiae bacterium]
MSSQGGDPQLAQLRERDHEVKSAQALQVARAGQYMRGAPTVDYKMGPDGRFYAVSVNVSYNTTAADTPEATQKKAEAIRTAALSSSGGVVQATSAFSAAAMLEMTAKTEKAKQVEAGQQETVLQKSEAQDEPRKTEVPQAASVEQKISQEPVQQSVQTLQAASLANTTASSSGSQAAAVEIQTTAVQTQPEEVKTEAAVSQSDAASEEARRKEAIKDQMNEAAERTEKAANYIMDAFLDYSTRHASAVYGTFVNNVIHS